MSESFSAKLVFIAKALSVSRATLASELQVDKSLVGRWMTGVVRPTTHNLSRLSVFVSRRVPGFSDLDWDLPLADLAMLLGAHTHAPIADSLKPSAPPPFAFPMIEESLATTARRSAAYEGFYRSTRPFPRLPGRFIHDHYLIRRDGAGNLGFEMISSGVVVQGYVWLLNNQVFVVAAEMTSGSFAYAILNGVSAVQAAVLDGLTLMCALDAERTPTASTIMLQRIGEITGDIEADHQKLVALGQPDSLAPEGSVPEAIARHLNRQGFADDAVLPANALLSLPVSRSLARGV